MGASSAGRSEPRLQARAERPPVVSIIVTLREKMSKLTNTKIIISGSTIESYEYKEKSVLYGFSNGRKGQPRKKILIVDEESKQRKIESRRRSLQRANSTLRRLINANAWKWNKPSNKAYIPVFVTFTFKEEIREIKTANKIFSRFIKKFNYEISGSKKVFLKYVTVIEFQDKNRGGVVHYHTIFFNLRFIHTDTLTKIWGQGYTKIQKIDHVDNAGAYVSKYMSKHFEDDRLDGRKRYFSSRGLLKPIEIKEQATAQKILRHIPKSYIKKEKDFVSKYQGKVGYTQFMLDKKETIFDIVPDLDWLI